MINKIIPMPNFPDYSITKGGEIWSNKLQRFLKPTIGNHGYFTVGINRKSKLVHRLILETFVGPCPLGMECRHKDCNKLNNNLSNIQWGTRSENRQDSIRNGTFYTGDKKGEKHPGHKLTNKLVLQIRSLYRTKEFSQRYLAKQFEITQAMVCYIVNNKNWTHVGD